MSGKLEIIGATNTHLNLTTMDGKSKLQLNHEWLRENCRCSSCYNAVTYQRNVRIFDIKADVHPTTYSMSENYLNIEWNDGHCSEYELKWLISQNNIEDRPQEILWSGDISNDVVFVTASEIKSQHGLTKLVKSLLEYGVGFVTNVEPDMKSTKEVIQCVGPPQQTLFGGMWQFSDKMDHLDTAYTNLALDAHTDTSYFIQPVGLIIFHCINRNCSGGKTLLVDGFRAAKEVQLDEPELYQCLRTVSTEFQYIEKCQHLTSMSTMIDHSPEDRIRQIRYNIYDRSSRSPFPASKCSLFYRSLRRLADAVRRPSAEWWFTLEPGTVVFINNWRVLHGRSAYKGQRTIAGAYVSMGNLLSRVRCLGLIR